MAIVDPDNEVNVGSKELREYIQAVQTQANIGNDEIRIQARGRHISRAVDLAEIVTSAGNKFLKGYSKASVETGTDPRPKRDGQDRVSLIIITIRREPV